MRLFFTFFLCYVFTFGHAQLSAGSIIFVGVNADGNDNFAFVVLEEIPANQSISFNDNEWIGTMFNNANEGIITWTNSGTSISPGTVVQINDASTTSRTTSVGTISASGSFDLSGSNEALFAYTGTVASPTFLTAHSNDDPFSETGATLTGTGLTIGSNVTIIAGDEDVMSYTGSTVCNGTITECSEMIVDPMNWTTDDGTGDQSASYNPPASFSGSALPVQLISFNANLLETEVYLTWSTATEINNDYFLLEWSTYGMAFQEIEKVNGNTDSRNLNKYQTIHSEPIKGVNYYRLSQVDLDGTKKTFPIKSVSFDIENKGFSILPTFVNTNMKIQFGQTVSEGTLLLFNSTGRLVKEFQLVSGINELDINMPELPSGTYFIQYVRVGELSTERFVKL